MVLLGCQEPGSGVLWRCPGGVALNTELSACASLWTVVCEVGLVCECYNYTCKCEGVQAAGGGGWGCRGTNGIEECEWGWRGAGGDEGVLVGMEGPEQRWRRAGSGEWGQAGVRAYSVYSHYV